MNPLKNNGNEGPAVDATRYLSCTAFILIALISGCASPDKSPYKEAKDVADLSVLTTQSRQIPLLRPPAPGAYVAFSLRSAEDVLSQSNQVGDFRMDNTDLYQLGGITKLIGLVFDRQRSDLILIGQYQPNRPALTLDDLCVAFKSRLIYHALPVVSIDPILHTDQQAIRLEGGIIDTQFGADLLKADYLLKEISNGLEPTRVEGVKGDFDVFLSTSDKVDPDIAHQMWFFPKKCDTVVRGNIAVVKGLEMAVGYREHGIVDESYDITQSHLDGPSARFARAVTDNFDAFCTKHVEFLRLLQLTEVVAVSRSIEALDPVPNLDFWTQRFNPETVQTPRTIPLLWRKAHRTSALGEDESSGFTVTGGVKLTALALRYRGGDIAALKDAVLQTRPKLDSLSWSFLIGNRLQALQSGQYVPEDLDQLRTSAQLLLKQGDYSSALPFVNCILDVQADDAIALAMRGFINERLGRFDEALTDLSESIKLKPNQLAVYMNRVSIYARRNQWQEAIADCSSVLERDPTNSPVLARMGWCRYVNGEPFEAIHCLDKALVYSPEVLKLHLDRAWMCVSKETNLTQVADEFTKLVALRPTDPLARFYQALALDASKQFKEAKTAYQQTIALCSTVSIRPLESGTNQRESKTTPQLVDLARERLAIVDSSQWRPPESAFLSECLDVRRQ